MAHRLPTRRAGLAALALIALLLGFATNTFTAIVDTASRRFAPPVVTSALPVAKLDQLVVANGISVRLASAEFASDATTLHLELVCHAASVGDDTFLPITPDRVLVTGVGGDPATFGTTTLHTATDGILPLDLVVGPVTDRQRGATVTIT